MILDKKEGGGDVDSRDLNCMCYNNNIIIKHVNIIMYTCNCVHVLYIAFVRCDKRIWVESKQTSCILLIHETAYPPVLL